MTNTCTICSSHFEHSAPELAYYEKVGPEFDDIKYHIPIPQLCPECRRQRRCAFRNQGNLYMRECDLTGRKCISCYHPGKPYPVYHHEDWWALKHSMLQYGRDFDFSRPFFEQFLELRNDVPVESARIVNCENSEYTNNARKCKNCYLLFGCMECDECMYLDGGAFSRNCILGWQISRAELSHCIYRCDKVFCCCFCELCFSCSDLWFCKLCKDCTHCFGCCQLRHKQYCIFNKQYSKQAYFDFLKSINTGSRDVIEYWRKKTQEFYLSIPESPYKGFNNEDCTGDVIFHSKRCRDLFTATYCEDSRYVWECNKIAHACDLDNTNVATGLCYQTIHSTILFNTQFAVNSHNCADCTYITECIELKKCFGCISLYNKEYCILNKQYSREDYNRLVPKIIAHMRATGEWGQFFPPYLSRFGYNETPSGGQYPLERDQALEQGFPWSDYVEPREELPDLIEGADLPDDIADVPDSIVEHPIACEITGKRFRIQKNELAFYRKLKLPVPRRYVNKNLGYLYCLRKPMRLHPHQCDNVVDGKRCPNTFESAHDSESRQKVYCEDCFHEASYHLATSIPSLEELDISVSGKDSSSDAHVPPPANSPSRTTHHGSVEK